MRASGRARGCVTWWVERVHAFRAGVHPSHHQDELSIGVTEGVERAEAGEVVGERVEFRERRDGARPDEGRGLAEEELPALLALQLEGLEVGLGHGPSE